MYDAETSRTINLDQVASIIRSGEDITVIDQNGKDITSHVLSQTFLKLQDSTKEPLFNFILKALIRESNQDFISLVKKLIFAGIGITYLTGEERSKIINLILNNERNLNESGAALEKLSVTGQSEVEKIWDVFVKKLDDFSGQVNTTIQSTIDTLEKQEHFSRIEKKIKELASTVEKINK